MSLLSVIKSAIAGEKQETTSSETAKNRLHFLLIDDRPGSNPPDFLPQLRQDLIEAIRKHIPIVTSEDVDVKYETVNGAQLIEMSISIDSDYSNRTNK